MGDTAIEFIDKVREANRIEQVMPQLVSKFKGFETDAQANLKCLCPFHKRAPPSFVVYPRDQYYRCFRCERMGDVFDLVQGLKGGGFLEALDLLARRARMPRPELTDTDVQSELEIRALQDILGAAADFYYQTIMQGRGWYNMLRADPRVANAVKQAKLGSAEGSDLAEHLASRGFDLELAKKAGVLKQDGSDFFQGTSVAPHFDKGRVVYMSWQSGTDSDPLKGRDLSVNEAVRRALPIAETLQKAGKLIIVEGYVDALTLKKWGYNAVPLAGMALSEHEFRLLRDHDKVYVWFKKSALERAMDLGKRIVRQSGVVPWIVEPPLELLDQADDAPRGYFLFGCEGRLGNSQDVLSMILERIPSYGGGDWENAVREFFGCLCCLSQFETAEWKYSVVAALGITKTDFEAYVKTARRREKTSQRVPARDVPDGSCLEIHPALDYAGEIGVVTVALDVIIDSRVVARPYLITSNREKLELDGRQLQIDGKGVILKSQPRAPLEKRWKKADIERFLEGDDPQPSKTFSSLLDIVRRHIDFKDPVQAEILAIWCMGTYLFPLFGAYPYLHLYGLKGSGKTQSMTLASKIAFNMVLTSGVTPSATFRLVQSCRCCIGLDEAEDLRGCKDRDGRGLLRFLRAGYKEGASVIIVEGGSDEGFRPRQYDVYSPKMIASASPIEDILDSRCISVNMLRTKNPQMSKVELSDDSEGWAGMRHELYCFALNHFREVRKLYSHEAGIKILLNRDNELWRPLFAVAQLLDEQGAGGVLDRLVEYASRVSDEESASGLEDFDIVLITALEYSLGRDAAQAKWIYAESIERIVKQNMAGSYLPKQVAQKVGYSLRNLGFLSNPKFKKRSATGVMYYIRPEDVADIRDRYGIKSVWSEPLVEGNATPSAAPSGAAAGPPLNEA
jgi:hypothetical protein